MRKFSAFLLFISFSSTIYAQDIINKNCGFSTILNEIVKVAPNYENEYQQLFLNSKTNPNNRFHNLVDTIYTVQVAVHIVYLANNKYENIPDSIVKTQIDALNRDFNSLNADSLNLRDFFKPFRGNAKIKFELAKFKPNGSPTTGIEHVQGKLGTVGSFNPILDNMKRSNDLLSGILGSGTPSWVVSKYLNIWVCDLNFQSRKCRTCLNLCDTCGALGGYAYPPANIPHWEQVLIIGGDTIRQNSALNRGSNDGIVIDFRFFGQNNWFARDSMSERARTRYGQGRTTVHEVGHYFGLRHTWGDAIEPLTPNGCVLDDYIDDTPNNNAAFANEIPDRINNPCDTSINSCDDQYLGRDYPDMFENYMDYSGDLCYNLFTKQQVDFMRLILTTKRTGIIINREVESIPTAINNTKLKENGISIYPNPAKNTLNILLEKPLKSAVNVSLIDVSGKVVINRIISANTTIQNLDISALANGMYMIQFSNLEFSAIDKLVKE
jgi:hypothetical protein